MNTQSDRLLTLFLCGDVMTGRGLDQILPYPVDPTLHESWVKSAGRYVKLAEEANGPITRPVSFSYIWGDALDELQLRAPDLRMVNLETSVTESDEYCRGKEIHYRMHPANIPCLQAAGIDFCALANNHVLDWGYPGLAETLETLDSAQIRSAGAGECLRAAEAPAVMKVGGKGRVLVFSYGSRTSGIPHEWAATEDRPGVNLLKDSTVQNVRQIKEKVAARKREGDVVVVSIHWGGNWGYAVPDEQRALAHALIDEARVDLIHGHSSHHVKGIEVYHDRLILYGAGDFLNDYEGIGGYEDFRDDLTLMYFASVDLATGRLARLQMTPMQIRQFKAIRASKADVLWLARALLRDGKHFGTRVEMNQDGTLELLWG